MLKTIRDMLMGALVTASVTAALAVGIAPGPGDGPELIEGRWAYGIVQGVNWTYQSGITAHAGGTQAACLSLTPGVYLYEIDTVASSNDSVCLPFAQQGTNFSIRNAGAQTVAIYGQSASNPAVSPAAADTINGTAGSSSYTVAANNNVECFAAKTGSWSCVKGN
jgi:hypothetical protein